MKMCIYNIYINHMYIYIDITKISSPRKFSNFATLQEELPVRLANRIAHLDMLPDLEARSAIHPCCLMISWGDYTTWWLIPRIVSGL